MPSTSTVQYVVLVAAGALACMPGMRACGGDVVSQNFDHYSGGWQPWIKTMAKEDFPRDADGNYGLIFLKDDTLQDVGEGMLRVRNPQGVLLVSGTARHLIDPTIRDIFRYVGLCFSKLFRWARDFC